MKAILSRSSKITIVHLIFLLLIYLFFSADHINNLGAISLIPNELFNVNTIFLSIMIEAVPFILIGVIASAIIQTVVSDNLVQKLLPRHAFLAMLPATLLGIIFPICECAIIPVVRRLIKKGMPQHVGVVFMLSVPILNPIVFLSTYYAFPNNHVILYGRMVLAFLVILLIGSIVFLFFRNQPILKHTTERNQHTSTNKMGQFFKHVSDEFFDTGKYLFVGALLASLFHTFLDRNLLVSIGTNHIIAPAVMMGFSYILSICSEADAFVASSFSNSFGVGSIIAFLVLGPMLDLKNTIMLFAYFRFKFVLIFIVITCCIVYIASRLFEYII